MTEKNAIISKIDLKNINLKDIKINVSSSKSYLNRALILASISPSQTILTNINDICDDVKEMIEALKKIGVKIKLHKNKKDKIEITIFGTNGKFTQPKDKIINCGLGGTTTRFLLGLSALFKFDITITAQGKMLERPLKEMLDFLKTIGKEILYLNKEDCLPVLIKHKNCCNVKKINLDGSKSSQFLSSILMVASKLKIEEIEVKNLVSKSYVNITLDVLKKFGLNFKHQATDDTIIYKLGKSIKNNNKKINKIEIEKDWSSASYFLALQYLLKIKKDLLQISQKSSQGDAKFIKILQRIDEYKRKKEKKNL